MNGAQHQGAQGKPNPAHVAASSSSGRALRLIAGAGCLAYAALRRTRLGWVALAAGLSLIVDSLAHKRAAPPKAERPRREPGVERAKPFGEGTRDRVDEASWESFPASDPPAIP